MTNKPNLTRLQTSLLLLVSLNNQIATAFATLTREDRIKDEDLKFTIHNYVQILLCSFLGEWSILESLGDDDKIRDTLKIASPALDRIRKWKGLPKIRSKLLAHGHRERNGNPAWAWEVFAEHEAPTAYAKMILLGNCALLAVNAALIRHQIEYQEAARRLLQLNRNIKVKGIETVGEIKTELDKINFPRPYGRGFKLFQTSFEHGIFPSLDLMVGVFEIRGQ